MRRVVVFWVGFCRASEIAAVYLTQPTEIPFHLASRVYRALRLSQHFALFLYPLSHALSLFLALSGAFHLFFSLTLIYFIRAILAMYATYPRPHRAAAHRDKLWRV